MIDGSTEFLDNYLCQKKGGEKLYSALSLNTGKKKLFTFEKEVTITSRVDRKVDGEMERLMHCLARQT